MNYLPQSIASQLLKFARYQLELEFGLSTQKQKPWVPPIELDFQRVNITLRRGGKLLASWGSRASSLEQAIANATHRAAVDRRFGGHIVLAELSTITIELLIQTHKIEILDKSIDSIASDIDLGVDGIELSKGKKSAYFKPSVAITHNIRSHKRLLNRLTKKAGLSAGEWADAESRLFKTRWLHFVEYNGQAVELYRMRRRWNRPISSQTLFQATAATLGHLIGVQRADGAYTYIVEPLKNELDNTNFSMVRMAGSTYALARTAAFWPESELKERAIASSRRAIAYLLRRSSPVFQVKGAEFIAERLRGQKRYHGKLGASALVLMALQYSPFKQEMAQTRASLVQGILSLQQDDGQFLTQFYSPKWEGKKKPERDRAQDFYPGEALLALAHEWKSSHDSTLLERIRLSFPHYKKRFGAAPATAFILWQGDAWSIMAEECFRQGEMSEAEEYADFVFQQIEWVIPLIYSRNNTSQEDWVGGLTRPKVPRGTTTSCIMEALYRATGLAAMFKDEGRVARYREIALDGLNFQLRSQIEACECFAIRRPALALGE